MTALPFSFRRGRLVPPPLSPQPIAATLCFPVQSAKVKNQCEARILQALGQSESEPSTAAASCPRFPVEGFGRCRAMVPGSGGAPASPPLLAGSAGRRVP